MATDQSVPFKVGQLGESRSFTNGFRGAWFRCKVMKFRRLPLMVALEFCDYPDEKVSWTLLYQKPPGIKRKERDARVLMVRPLFPPVYHENEIPDVSAISDVIVVIDGTWKVGDLVDWHKDNCYWSGRVTEIKGNNKVQVQLPDPPAGEGLSYEAHCKDLRPSLDWSPECGWTVPASSGTNTDPSHIRLIRAVEQGGLPKQIANTEDAGNENSKATSRSSLEFHSSVSSHTSTCSLPLSKGKTRRSQRTNTDPDAGSSRLRRTSCSDSLSSAMGKTSHDDGSSKKRQLDEVIPLNSRDSDSIDSMILDLEELVNRVKWLKRILKDGGHLGYAKSGWKFLEHHSVASQK